MKPSFKRKLGRYVFIRVLLSSAIICIFSFGVSPLIDSTAPKVIITSAFALAMCLFTAKTIARHVIELVATPLTMILESAKLLEQASCSMTDAAKGMEQNADIMMEFKGVIDGMASACEEASKVIDDKKD